MTSISQERITLKNLKVAEFASEGTLCFSATVLLDGEPIAVASNDGRGGMTLILPRDGKRPKLLEAEKFAASLPPDVTEFDDPQDRSKRLTIEITLDYLVDDLANTMHSDKKIRTAFNRDISNKVLFVKDGKLLFLKGVMLKGIPDRAAYFANLRARQGQSITILAELAPDEAFSLWKQHTITGGSQ
ncbi:TPA: hypothetical protein L4Q76_001694 [Pseudomonas aeruginosa]|uniref:hypothetical protein n=1 Tax=Pseudomonas aeruginosa TaxID=287 RepID=UPI0003B99A42|nr:hypothetical protein [Pseudomonas aeruginosa]EKT9494438.1 hypothetical protein [Pseudomonas aeruginosa]ERY35629.1 hypothetical protein Q067_02264 [Pseudomonas aeruginosa BL13]MBH4028483.1 hypothetical protein [Pseudomonas aeruginosa]MBV5530547.1 hypothetical protein [Pseudomonas aeruginosa]MCS8095408.1 hypothetical protein [Pseudomonas aeruginosa]